MGGEDSCSVSPVLQRVAACGRRGQEQRLLVNSILLQLQHNTATQHCNTLQHTATHEDCLPTAQWHNRNTLQKNATHCSTLQHTKIACQQCYDTALLTVVQRTAAHCNTYCNTLQHTATHYNTLHHPATHCNCPLAYSAMTHIDKRARTHCSTHAHTDAYVHERTHKHTHTHTHTHIHTHMLTVSALSSVLSLHPFASLSLVCSLSRSQFLVPFNISFSDSLFLYRTHLHTS